MTYKVTITAGAERDLDAIFAYIVQDNPRAARQMVSRLYEKIALSGRCPGDVRWHPKMTSLI